MNDYKRIKVVVAEPTTEVAKNYEVYFTDKLLIPIGEILGQDKWGICFRQKDILIKDFYVDIYTDKIDNKVPIRNLCIKHLEQDIKMSFDYPQTFDSFFLTQTL